MHGDIILVPKVSQLCTHIREDVLFFQFPLFLVLDPAECKKAWCIMIPVVYEKAEVFAETVELFNGCMSSNLPLIILLLSRACKGGGCGPKQ